jgi:acyl-CoA thioesterase-2
MHDPVMTEPTSAASLGAIDPMKQLLGLFELVLVEPDHYVGQSLDLGYRNLFGGHILGQSLMAATLTAGARRAHSLHAYFLRGGDAQRPIDYHVDRIRDGKSFVVRRVTASQQGQAILILSTSFQSDERGFEHQVAMPDVPPPEGLKVFVETKLPPSAAGSTSPRKITTSRAIEIRPVPTTLADRARPAAEIVQHAWFRAVGPVPDDAALHRSLLAYASDFGLLTACMRPHSLSFTDPGLVVASLDHALWFYNDFRIDDWLLYATDSPAASSARGLNRGNIFRRDGTLVACVAQEALIRKLDGRPA